MNVILVTSGKGGVGKSTVAVLTAIALSKEHKTALVDIDITCPSIAKILDITGEKPGVDSDSGKILPYKYNENLEVFSIGQDVPMSQHIAWKGDRVSYIVRELLEFVNWDDPEYFVFDMPPGTSDEIIFLLNYFKNNAVNVGGLLVSLPTELSIMDVERVNNLFHETSIPVYGVIENMSGKMFGRGKVKEFCQEKGLNFISSLPMKVELRKVSEGTNNIEKLIEKYKFDEIVGSF